LDLELAAAFRKAHSQQLESLDLLDFDLQVLLKICRCEIKSKTFKGSSCSERWIAAALLQLPA
jgi:hypothetical protein